MTTKRRLTPWMIGVGVVTFLAGIITSWVTLGALFGALVAGGTADKIGCRWTRAWDMLSPDAA
jgi:hypothetical protein